MSWWKNRSHFSGHSGDSPYSTSTDEYGGGGQHEETRGRRPSPSRPKRSGGKKADDDYPSYTANTNQDGDNDDDGGNNDDGDYNYNGTYSGGGYNGYGGAPYNSSTTTPYYGGGAGYNNNSSYGNGGDGYTGGGAHMPYNAPATTWAPQDPAARTPMFINTREVHVYGVPGSQNDGDYNSDQRGRGGGGGLFGPAFETVGHFVDRKFGFNDRN